MRKGCKEKEIGRIGKIKLVYVILMPKYTEELKY
jgi:hypothetical protein